jgi:hypothetical protein
VPDAVEIGRVEQRNAGVERRLNRGEALGLVGRAVEVGHTHAA